MPPTQNAGGQTSSKRQVAMSWSEKEILNVFNQMPQKKANGCAVTGFRYPPKQPIAYVKFGWAPERKAELRNHKHAFESLRAMPPDQTRGILIPEIYRAFESNDNLFIVMEYIPGDTLAQLQGQPEWASRKKTVINNIARAIGLLMSIPAPPGQKPGPVGGGIIRHPLFKDDTSYCEYPSVDELEKHLNRVAITKNKKAPTVSLERNLCFYYSDFFAGNFIITQSNDLCLIDFDQAGFLPLSFMSYAVAESHWPPGLWIKDILRLPERNLEAMKTIAGWFGMSVDWFGLPPEMR